MGGGVVEDRCGRDVAAVVAAGAMRTGFNGGDLLWWGSSVGRCV